MWSTRLGIFTSFVSERLAQSPLSTQNIRISGITGMSPLQSIATFSISTMSTPVDHEKLQMSAIVVPRVTCDLPTQPVHFNAKWSHLNDLHLADPDFGQPNKIDILLGVDVYADVLLQGRRNGPPGTPTAFETKFGWVLTGKTDDLKIPSKQSHSLVTTFSAKLRNAQEVPLTTLQKNALLFAILMKPTREMKMADLWYHSPKTLRQNYLESSPIHFSGAISTLQK